MGSKRRRLALSCVDCRRRKVKCDRSFPSCIRCQKGGNADTCTYVAYDDHKLPNTLPTPNDDNQQARRDGSVDSWGEVADLWQSRSAAAAHRTEAEAHAKLTGTKRPAPEQSIQDLQERVSELEAFIKLTGGRQPALEKHFNPSSSTITRTSVKPASLETERCLLRGKAFRTHYHGPSHPCNVLLEFEELSAFVKRILLRVPPSDNMKETIKRIEYGLEKSEVLNFALDKDKLISMVPPRVQTDILVEEYLNTIETTFRIVHVPTFKQKYEQFWLNPKDSSEGFVVQLLLIMACFTAFLPGDETGFVGRTSIARLRASEAIDVCDAWLTNHSRKHTTLEYWQGHVLSVLAKRLNYVKIKREWTCSGNLLRLAMAAGMHREPSMNKKISPFQAEMRRRLWYTILEFDIQAACHCGFPASIGPLDFDCMIPLNVHDEDFGETTLSMPSPKPLTEFTRSSFLTLLSQNIALRLEILSRVNSVKYTIDLETVLDFDEKIRKGLNELPPWQEKSASSVARTVSKLVLYEYLIVLHQQFATEVQMPSRYFYSRAAQRNASLTTLTLYSNMSAVQAMVVDNIRGDSARAILTTCHDLVVFTDSAEDLVHDKNLALNLMEQAVNTLKEKVRHLGEGFHPYWICSSALYLVKSKNSPSTPSRGFEQEGADNMLELHSEIKNRQLTSESGRIAGDKLIMRAAKVNEFENQSVPSSLPDGFDPLTPMDPFNDSIFNFDMTDIWNYGVSQI